MCQYSRTFSYFLVPVIALLVSIAYAQESSKPTNFESVIERVRKEHEQLKNEQQLLKKKKEEYFEYGGINLGTTMSLLRNRYPKSTFNHYQGRLVESESHDEIQVISVRSKETLGIISVQNEDIPKEVIISFQKESVPGFTPTDWREGHYARHPDCDVILSRLVNKYGMAKQNKERWEVRLEWISYRWKNEEFLMQLWCYRPDGKGEFLAGQIKIGSIDI